MYITLRCVALRSCKHLRSEVFSLQSLTLISLNLLCSTRACVRTYLSAVRTSGGEVHGGRRAVIIFYIMFVRAVK